MKMNENDSLIINSIEFLSISHAETQKELPKRIFHKWGLEIIRKFTFIVYFSKIQ